MVLTTALLIVLLALGVVYVLAPLFRDEEELGDLDRPRPGTRTLHGPNPEETRDRRAVPLDGSVDQCPDCGAAVEREYRYCGECLARVR